MAHLSTTPGPRPQAGIEHSGRMCHPVVTSIGSATVHWLFTIALIAAAAAAAVASGYLAYRLSGLGRS